MAKFILKWRYIKSGSPNHNRNLVKYIATRDGVEICDESWKYQKATREQSRLIKELLAEFPSLKDNHEYNDYITNPTKYTASQLISKGIDENIDLLGKKENYIGYIAKRPRVEKQGTHGLFSDKDEPIDLDAVAKGVAEHEGFVWTTIMSLRREDAARLNFDNASAWRTLLRGQAETLANAMGIPMDDLRWYAAFHNEGSHPHIHLVSYSVGKQPYMTEKGLQKMKSAYANEIFRQDLVHTYTEQTKHRDELREYSAERIKEIISQISGVAYENETVEAMLIRLKEELQDYTGKRQYGYLPKSAKNLVDGIVDEIAKDERVKELYELWYEQKDNVLKTYTDKKADRLPFSQNNEFKTIRNAVLRELQNLSLTDDTVEELPNDEETDNESTDEDIEDNEPNTSQNQWELYFEAKKKLDRDSEEYNPKQAVELFIGSAKLGCGIAKYQLGKLFLRGEHIPKNIEYALRWLEDAVEENNQYAEYLLGKALLKGEDTEQNTERAEELLKRSAAQGNKYAAYTLGKAHLDGDMLEQDIAESLKYLTSSTDKGFPQAQYLLGKIYLTEKSVKNPEKAAKHFKIAADQGNDYAQYQLGKMHLYGNGVKKDYEKAKKYLNTSAENGNQYAESLLQIMASNRNFSASLGVLRLFQYMTRIIQNRLDDGKRGKLVLTERKLRRQINDKKQAQGIKIE